MPDQVVVTTRKSWFSRIGGAFAGVVVGLILIVASVAGLAWNEGRAVKVARALDEGLGLVVEAPASAIVPDNDQRLVHVVGQVAVTAPLTDPQFGVSATGVRLSRKVEMYQWREDSESQSRTRPGGGEETTTTYRYSRVWSAEPIESSRFNTPADHENPAMTLQAADFLAGDATLGAYRLDEQVLWRMEGAQTLALDAEAARTIEAAAGQGRSLTVAGDAIYLGRNPSSPAIGDTRISYELTPAVTTSVVARQDGGALTGYRARNGTHILLTAEGVVQAADMFEQAKGANVALTWGLRGVGLVVLMAGFGLILAPFGVLADVLPLAGTVVRMGTGLIGFVLGLLVGGATIALAWLTFRPLLAILILAVAAAVSFGAWRLGLRRARKAAPAEA